jgi:hypothetical protein
MADRFPSLEEFDAGKPSTILATGYSILNHNLSTGSTEIRDLPTDGATFLERERAALGEDADQFATPQDNLATVEDAGDDDLLGGDGVRASGADDITGFDSSFPAIDTRNDVCPLPFP